MFHPDTGVFSPLPSVAIPELKYAGRDNTAMNWPSYWRAVLLADDTVYITGGSVYSNNPKYLYYASLIYDPKSGKTKQVKDMIIPRRNHHVMVRLKDGKVLIAGGNEATGENFDSISLKEAEIYNPVTNRYTRISDMNYPPWES